MSDTGCEIRWRLLKLITYGTKVVGATLFEALGFSTGERPTAFVVLCLSTTSLECPHVVSCNEQLRRLSRRLTKSNKLR
jgi:hypothetical protein